MVCELINGLLIVDAIENGLCRGDRSSDSLMIVWFAASPRSFVSVTHTYYRKLNMGLGVSYRRFGEWME